MIFLYTVESYRIFENMLLLLDLPVPRRLEIVDEFFIQNSV